MPPDLIRGASQSPKSSPGTLSSSLMYGVLERWQLRLALLPASGRRSGDRAAGNATDLGAWQLAGQGEGPSVNQQPGGAAPSSG
jgi:hypothetical protein